MDDIGLYDCPMPESFRDKIGLTLSLAWLFYLGFVTRVIFGPLMPQIRQDLGLGNGDVGYLFLMITIGYTIAPLFSGYISSRLYHSGTLRLSAWLLGVVLLPFMFVNSFWAMSLVLMVIGFTGFLHLPSAIATITAEIQKSDWGKGLGVHQCAPPLAFVTAPLIAALMLNWFSWRVILLSWAVLSLVSALVFTVSSEGGAFPGRPLNPGNVKRVVSLPSFWLLALLLGMGMAGNAGILSMLPLFFVTERGFDLGLANSLIGFSQLSGFVVVFFAGIVADKVGHRKFMCFTLSSAALLTVSIGFLTGWPLVIALIIQPAVLTPFFPAAFGALARVAHPTLRSVTSAIGPPLGFLVGAGGIPMLIAQVAEHRSFGLGIVITGIFMLTGVPLVYFLRLGDYDDEAGC